MKCVNCGNKIKKNFKICPNCGEKINFEQKAKKNINKKIIVFVSIIIVFISILMITLMMLKNSKTNIAQLKESVVQIYVYDEADDVIATGSGVVVFENDIVLTNAHVIEDNSKLEVVSENNVKYNVDGIIGYNKKKDIAILKLTSSKNLKSVKINEKISVGDQVTAIGSPLGLKNTVSDGILSGYFQDNIEVYQHTAPISSGSSGGALFDNKGKLVGITYASINGGQNLNLAIPITEFIKEYNIVKNNKAIKTRYYSFLNNSILKTKNGSVLLDYILNDEYSNERFKSGVIDDLKKREGNLERCLSLSNCSYVFENNYNKVSDYISSSIYLNSGVSGTIGTVELINGEAFIDKSTSTEGEGYSVIMIKLNNDSSNAINHVKKFIQNEFEFDTFEIKNNNKYLYALSCNNYNNCDEVKDILEQFIK